MFNYFITGNAIGSNDLTYAISFKSQIIAVPLLSQLTAILNAGLKAIQDIFARWPTRTVGSLKISTLPTVMSK